MRTNLQIKKILFLLCFLPAFKTFACACFDPLFADKYIQSDFVAVVKIIQVYKNESEEDIYKADILIRDLYKGDSLKSIYIEGRSDGTRGGSCAIFIPEETELIIYANKNKNNQYSFGSCSGYLILNKGRNQKYTQERELEMLEMLKAKGINYTEKIRFNKRNGFSDELLKFNGVQLKKSFALFELIFTSDLAVKSINKISGFENDIDNDLTEILKKSEWVSSEWKSPNIEIRNSVPDRSKLLVGFYFYEAKKEYKSFVGHRDL